ncbi:MAG: hypothetical protein U0414_20910 [Polyangiaceae bacterium]
MRVNERHAPSGALELFVDTDDQGYVVTAPTIGTFRISVAGEVLDRSPDWSAHGASAEAYFAQQISPLLAQLSGKPNLHGSAVELRGQAVGFIGRSGHGKSTLAASLAADGALLADDSIAITLEGGTAWCTPGSSFVRLRDDSLAVLGASAAHRASFGKTEVDLREARGRAALRRLFVLEAAAAVRIEPIRPRDALVALAANAHRLDPTDKRLLAAEVAFFEGISRAVPMSRLQVPRDFSKLPLVKQAILSELGGFS